MNTDGAGILVVDDTRANLRLLAQILANKNYIVRPVMDGATALTAVDAEPPDLILLDVRMPRMDGYEVCMRLKASEKTRDIPVIFISAQTEVIDKMKAFSAGGVDYITKPFEAEEVLARVATHLNLRYLQKRLEENNKELTRTLEQLKSTQNQLILHEKMAALGQLIAGIAHEINTPLGAIGASIGNISNALHSTLCNIPRLFQNLSPYLQDIFIQLVKEVIENKKVLSSKEARTARRQLQDQLEKIGVEDTESSAVFLVNMGLTQFDPYIPLLKDKNRELILHTAYHLFVQENNSRNIATAVERASKIIFALKSYGRYEESKKIRARVTDGIEIVLTLYQNLLKRGISVSRDFQDNPEIFCNPDELYQVWTNLIHNAIQAMPNGGELIITVFSQPPYLIVQITDSGCGIPKDIQHMIFDPFFTTKPRGEGSGLGLDIVRKIIDRHNGKIEVESCPGKTTFSVFLPLEAS